jgi:pantoate--beta-alanine ligase
MKIFKKIDDIRSFLSQQQRLGKSIGLVPTMGALHQGHGELVKRAAENNDVAVASIFVNPIQFNNAEDLLKYPLQIEEDCNLLEANDCDVVFIPEKNEMYLQSDKTLKMNFGEIETVMEGTFRPGHFSGVGVVVAKLLNIIQPDRAYFGQKDLQQLAVIKKMAYDLNFKTNIVGVPTFREKNGLAMSSRNLRLTEKEKDKASRLYHVMTELKESIVGGADIQKSLITSGEQLNEDSELKLEYLEIVNSNTLMSVSNLKSCDKVSICAAAYIAGVRIIDNIYIK